MVLNGHTVMFVYKRHWRVVDVTETRYDTQGNITHIVGKCWGRDAIRCFRADRISLTLEGCVLTDCIKFGTESITRLIS